MLKDFLSLIRWDRPIGTFLLLWPTLGALVAAADGRPPLITCVVFTLGVFLTRSAGCAVNDVADAGFDKKVARTKDRPVAAGRISRITALIIAAVLSLIAFFLAYRYLQRNTLLLTIPALAIFVTYPYMKRFFPMPQAYLGIAFSFGILMAFVEINGRLNLLAWLLFLANIFWVLGYDTIYALADLEDDLKIGIKTSAVTLGKWTVPFITGCYIIYFIVFCVIGSILKLGAVYHLSLSLAGGFLLYQIIILVKAVHQEYIRLFLLNNWVGLCVLFGLVGGLFRLH